MAKVISSFLIVVLFSLMSNFANADSFGITLRYWLTEESIPNAEFTEIAIDNPLLEPALSGLEFFHRRRRGNWFSGNGVRGIV